jgi:4-oxalocrotonate tautomerase
MPIISIENAGKLSKSQKEDLIERVTNVVADVTGKASKSIYVKITEIPRENFGIGGKSLD